MREDGWQRGTEGGRDGVRCTEREGEREEVTCLRLKPITGLGKNLIPILERAKSPCELLNKEGI